MSRRDTARYTATQSADLVDRLDILVLVALTIGIAAFAVVIFAG